MVCYHRVPRFHVPQVLEIVDAFATYDHHDGSIGQIFNVRAEYGSMTFSFHAVPRQLFHLQFNYQSRAVQDGFQQACEPPRTRDRDRVRVPLVRFSFNVSPFLFCVCVFFFSGLSDSLDAY